MAEIVILTEVTWRSPPLAVFESHAAMIEARFGPPSARDLDSNGAGRFDAYCVRFACGLEVALSRFDRPAKWSRFEIHANQRDLSHIAFHLDVPVGTMSLWTDGDGVPVATAPPRVVLVMRTDDNGSDFEVGRFTNRCEAAALVRTYEARGHKQTYWIA